jgi:predicted small lipoprotein YifL
MRASLAAALALAALSTCTGCGGSGPADTNAASETEQTALSTRVRRNQTVLSANESRALLAWAERLRSCLSHRGIRTTLHVTRRDISLAVEGKAPIETLLKEGTRCGDSLGGPPPRSSLQAFKGMYVVYLPKQCLLDPKVARTATA